MNMGLGYMAGQLTVYGLVIFVIYLIASGNHHGKRR